MGWFILLGIACLLGVVFGWIAFFMAIENRRRVAALEARILHRERSQNADYPGEPRRETATAPSYHQRPAEPANDAQSPRETQPVWRDQSPASEETIKQQTAASSAPRLASGAAYEEPAQSQSQDAELPDAIDRWRRFVFANWLIFIGGFALLLGGAFLVKVAADAGFFSPTLRIIAALIAGGAMIFWAQWMRRGGAPEGSVAPPVLAAAGGATIYGAIYAAYGLYAMIPAVAAFVLLAIASAGLVVLAVVHRRQLMAGLAIVGAHLSPIITGDGGTAGVAFYLYIYAISAGGLAVAQFMKWRPIAWTALAGGLCWPAVFIAAGEVSSIATIAVYLPAFLVLAAYVVWTEMSAPLDIDAINNEGVAVSLIIFSASLFGALFCAFALTLSEDWSMALVVMWGVFAVLAFGFAAMREGLSLTPAITIPFLAGAVGLANAPEEISLLTVGAAFAGFYAVVGYFVMGRQKEGGPVAVASAFGASAMFCALFFSIGGFSQSPVWGFAAVLIAFFNMSALVQVRARAGGFDSAPGVAASYALGAALATTLAVATTFGGLAMSFGFAAQAPVIAWLWLRFRLPALQFAASALAALGALRLLFLPEVLTENVGELPFLNILILSHLVPASGFWLAARWFERGGASIRGGVVQGMEAAAISLFTLFLSLQVRHLFTGGDLDAPLDSIIEVSLQSVTWLFVAVFLRWRFADNLTPLRRLAEQGLLIVAALSTAINQLLVMNPWWGAEPSDVNGPFLFNMLALAYLAPAVAFAFAAYLARGAGLLLRARVMGMFALFMAYSWAILSVRHQFHAPDLSIGDILNGESWGYSIVTIIFATLMLVAAAFRRSEILRKAGFGVLSLAIFKVFVFDLSALEGLWRATSFLGLGAALIGIAVLYQRVLTPMMETSDEAAPDEKDADGE